MWRTYLWFICSPLARHRAEGGGRGLSGKCEPRWCVHPFESVVAGSVLLTENGGGHRVVALIVDRIRV